jgi:hypothetical protein
VIVSLAFGTESKLRLRPTGVGSPNCRRRYRCDSVYGLMVMVIVPFTVLSNESCTPMVKLKVPV